MGNDISFKFFLDTTFDMGSFNDILKLVAGESFNEEEIKYEKRIPEEHQHYVYDYHDIKKGIAITFFWYPQRNILIFFLPPFEIAPYYCINLIKKLYPVLKVGCYGRDTWTAEGLAKEESPDSRIWSVNLFTPQEVKKYGRKRLLNAPCDIIEEWEDGAIFMMIQKDRFSSNYWERKLLRDFITSNLRSVEGKRTFIRFFTDELFDVNDFIESVAWLGNRIYPEKSVEEIKKKLETIELPHIRVDALYHDRIGHVETSFFDGEYYYDFKLYNPKHTRWKDIKQPIFEVSVCDEYAYGLPPASKLLHILRILYQKNGWKCVSSLETDYINDFETYFNWYNPNSIWSVNLFPPEGVKKYGREKLLKAPCELIEEWEDGAIFMMIHKDKFSSTYEERKKLRAYLGVKQ